MTALVGEVLGREGVPVGNTPVGMWQYRIPEDSMPKVRYSGLF